MKKILGLKLTRLKNFQENSYGGYEGWQSFFQSTSDNTRNTIKYNPDSHKVIISGSGVETFKCNGEPVFKREDNQEKCHIPVMIGRDEAELTLYHTLSADFSPFDKFNVQYIFETSFSLGGNYDDKFTKNQRKIYSKNIDELFCGEPGKVYFRRFGALGDGFSKAIHRSSPNENTFNLHGRIYMDQKKPATP